MDDETILSTSLIIVFLVFMFSWKWMTWNMPPIYIGMIMPLEMMLSYIIAFGGIVIVIFMWIWVGLRN